MTHSVPTLGTGGFLMFVFVRDATLLLLAEVGIGIMWASILAMPYAILASNLPQAKLGIYMGLFNVFVVVPQLLVATVMGSIMQAFFPGEPVWTMLFAAAVVGWWRHCACSASGRPSLVSHRTDGAPRHRRRCP